MRKYLVGAIALGLMLTALPGTALGFCSDTVPVKYKEAATWLYEDEVLKGYPDGTCKLENPINRAESVTFMLRNAYGSLDNMEYKYSRGWNDVSLSQLKGEWYGPFIAKGNELGIIKGGADGRLRPGDQVIGSEMLVMTLRTEFGQLQAGDGQTWFDPYYDIARQVGMYTIDAGAKATRGDVVRTIFEMNKNFDDIRTAVANYSPSSSSVQPTAAPTVAPTQAPTISGPISWRQLVEDVDKLSAAQVANKLKNLNETEKLQLGIYGAYANLLHIMACDADPNLILDLGYGNVQNCATVSQSWVQTLQFSGGNVQQAVSYALEQRNQLLIGLKCGTGEIDAGSCSNYTGVLSNLNQMSHETSMRIISNMGGNSCLVGDPGCVPY